jgi:hypothetical protein
MALLILKRRFFLGSFEPPRGADALLRGLRIGDTDKLGIKKGGEGKMTI